MRFTRLLFVVAALTGVVVACSPAGSSPAATSGPPETSGPAARSPEPGASEPTLVAPSMKVLPTPTIEIPPPIY